MADLSKAERIAAARKKLQDFQRKKDVVTLPSTVSSAIFQSSPKSSASEDQIYEQLSPRMDLGLTSMPSLPSSNQYSHPEPRSGTFENESQQYVNGIVIKNGAFYDTTSLQVNQGNHQEFSDSHSNGTHSIIGSSPYLPAVDTVTSESVVNVSADHNGAQLHFPPYNEVHAHSTAHLFSHSDHQSGKWDLSSLGSGVSDSSGVIPVFGSEESSNQTSHDTSSRNFPFIHKEESGVGGSSSDPSTPSLTLMSEEPVKELFPSIASNLVGSESDHITLGKGLEISGNEYSTSESIGKLLNHNTHQSVVEEKELNSNMSNVTSIEAQNQELSALLAAEIQKNRQLQFALKESQSQVGHLEAYVLDLKTQQEVVLARHLGPLQEQLRAHAQTVGILVGEKTELESAIAHHTSTAKQHASEVEELQNRLRASRLRVSELEKELASVAAAALASDHQKNNHAQELDQLRLQNGMLSKQLEDAEEEASELRQKLSARVSEVGTLTAQLQDKQSQLSLAQLRVTQLSASDNPEASAEMESLHQLKISLERRCAELAEAVRQLTADRDQADQQYQQYVAQLNGQLQAANSKFESLSIENERLKSREKDLVQNMSELERQLQQQIQLQQQQQHQQTVRQEIELKEDQSLLNEQVALLDEDKRRLQSSLDLKIQEVASLQAELNEKDTRIADLETLCNDQPDQARLLAAMESDKVAAAQATSQNTILKQQLKELQDGFIKMSNDKLQLTEHLEHEKYVNKEMGEKISQLAEELHELRMLVSEKERRLQEYRDREHDHNHDHSNCHKDDYDHDKLHSDVIKSNSQCIHNTQSAHVASALGENLNQAQDHTHNLNSENNNLRRLIAQKSTESHESGSSSSATEGATTDDAAADINFDDNQDGVTKYSSMQYAMDKLQERFTRTMAEVAELSDEKQRLEHLVLQLQGETETIGEYVTLYQMQRAALQQRAREKDHQLASLSAEREDLRRKLQELIQLVQRLLEDRGTETAKDALQEYNEHPAHKDETDVIEIPVSSETSGQVPSLPQDVSQHLTKKILGILEDISVSTDTEASFHPCPWCSGRLKNV